MEEKLLEEMARIYAQMRTLNPTEEEYEQLMDRLGKLCELRTASIKAATDEKKADAEMISAKKQNGLNLNDIISAATNIIGIGLILNHEQLNVISTKALSFVKKLRF